MGEPQEYNVHEELKKHERPIGMVTEKVTVTDPADLLFRSYDSDLVKTDLTHWMTFLKKDRLKKVERYADLKGAAYSRFTDKKIAEDARRRYLALVFLRECLSVEGSSEVAMVCANLLLPPKG